MIVAVWIPFVFTRYLVATRFFKTVRLIFDWPACFEGLVPTPNQAGAMSPSLAPCCGDVGVLTVGTCHSQSAETEITSTYNRPEKQDGRLRCRSSRPLPLVVGRTTCLQGEVPQSCEYNTKTRLRG